jgi:TP901 family phage tail tape measure protein
MAGPTMDLGNLLVHLKADTAHWSRGMAIATASVRSFEKNAKRLVIAAGTVSAASVGLFARFDDAMVKSTAIMRDLSIETERSMRQAALAISKQGVTSAKDLAQAYFFLASAGLDAQQSMAALGPMQQFAAAGAFDMATATDLATDAQSALGLTVKDAAKNAENLIRVTDVLTGANTLANASTEQFSKALTSQAGPAMKAYGIQLEEGVAVLAAYADQGIKSENAGNMFSRMLRLMTKGFLDNRQAWRNFEVDIFNTEGNLRHLGDIINDLSKKLEGMTTRQKISTLTMLGFQARSQQAILPLIGLGDRIHEYNEELDQMNKITREIAEKQLRSFLSQLKLLKNQIVAVMIELGEHLAPNLEKINKWFQDNESTIRFWALTFGDYVHFAARVMGDFVQYLRSDWVSAMESLGDLIIDIVEMLGKTILEMSVKVGRSVWEGIRQGILGREVSDDDIWKRAMELYKKGGGEISMVKGKTQTMPSLNQYGGMVMRDVTSQVETPADIGAFTRALAEARRQLTRGFTDALMEDVVTSARFQMESLMQDFRGKGQSQDLFGFSIDKRLQELHSSKNLRHAQRWWNEVKRAVEPVVNDVTNLKDTVVGMFDWDLSSIFEGMFEQTKKSTEHLEKFNTRYREWAGEAEDFWTNLADVTTRAFENLSRTITKLVMEGKANFSDFIRQVTADLLQMAITYRIAMAASTAFPTLFGTGPGNNEVEAFGGMPSAQHGGEVMKTGLAVVHKGEVYSGVNKNYGIFNAPTINVINQSGTKIRQGGSPHFEMDKWVINIVAEDIETNGRLARMVQGR